MIKLYKVWGVKRKSDGVMLRVVVLADSPEEALTRVDSNPAVDARNAHTDESHSDDISTAPFWMMIEDDCSYTLCAEKKK
jgi:hypothetical protein